jgi:hypothetical protein
LAAKYESMWSIFQLAIRKPAGEPTG